MNILRSETAHGFVALGQLPDKRWLLEISREQGAAFIAPISAEEAEALLAILQSAIDGLCD